MSAVAAIITKDGAILLSDGLGLQIPAGEVHLQGSTLDYTSWEAASRDRSKLLKINDRVGLTWTGLQIPWIQDSFKQTCTDRGLTQPDQIADALSEQLREHFSGRDIAGLSGTPSNVNISVTGFDRMGTPWGINLTCSKDRPLLPDKHELGDGLSIACSLPFIEKKDSPFPRFLNKYKDCASIEEQAVLGFTDMIRTLESEGQLCGGSIFKQTLRPALIQTAGFEPNDSV